MPLIVPVGASNTSSNIYNLFSLSPYVCYKLAVRTHFGILSFVFYLNPPVLAHLSLRSFFVALILAKISPPFVYASSPVQLPFPLLYVFVS